MTSLILVTGGTGTLGKLVVPRLREAGAKVRVLSRQAREADRDVEYVRGDLDTGAGIEAAVRGRRFWRLAQAPSYPGRTGRR